MPFKLEKFRFALDTAVCLTRLCVDPAGVEKVGGKVDVDVTEEKQHVAPFPGPGPNVKAPPPWKCLVQLKQRVVLKINFPADKERVTRKQCELIQTGKAIQGERRLPAYFEEDNKYIFNLSLFSYRFSLDKFQPYFTIWYFIFTKALSLPVVNSLTTSCDISLDRGDVLSRQI